MLKRLVLVGMLIVSIFVVAGCGESEADRKANAEKAIATAQAKALETSKEGQAILSDPAKITKIFQDLTNKPELKGQDLKIFQGVNLNIDQGSKLKIIIALLKPGTANEVVQYTWSGDKAAWSDAQPVKLAGSSESRKYFTANLYDYSRFKPELIAGMIQTYEAQVKEKNPKEYRGVINSVAQGLNVDNQAVGWLISSVSANQPAINARFAEDGSLVNYSVH